MKRFIKCKNEDGLEVLFDSTFNPFLLEDCDGIYSVANNVSVSENTMTDGGTYQGSVTSVRNIVLTLRDDANSDHEANRTLLYKLFKPKSKGTFIYFEHKGAESRSIDYYVESIDIDGKMRSRRYTVSLICTDPFFVAPEDLKVTMAGWVSAFEFPFELLTKDDANTETNHKTIKETAIGEEIHLTDSADGKAVEYALFGKARQDGEPTPENPQPIEVSGESYNLLENKGTTQTINDVTFTVNEDGSVNVNGTATDKTVFYLCDNPEFEGVCKLTGCPNGGGSSTYCIEYSNYVDYAYRDYGSGVDINKFDYSRYPNSKAVLVVYKGATVNNIVFKPMIRKASVKNDRYMPYGKGSVEVTSSNEDNTKNTKATIPTTNGLAGIPVDSGGNYTDQNGQQWICDEVVKYADGSGKHIQRIGIYTYNGTESIAIADNNTRLAVRFLDDIKLPKENDKNVIANGIVTDRVINTQLNAKKGEIGFARYSGNTYSYFSLDEFATVEEAKTYFSYGNTTVYYELAEPITTPLTAEQLADIETFYPVTNISNDAECGMKVTYFAYTKAYIEFGTRIEEKLKTIDNTSAAENIGLTITISAGGNIKNPSIYHVEKNEQMTVGTADNPFNLVNGDSVIITTGTNDKHAYLVHNGVKTEINAYLSEDSEFIQLQHGFNTIGYSAESGEEHMTVEISYRYRYLGA